MFLLSVLIPRTWLIGCCVLGALIACLRPLGKFVVPTQHHALAEAKLRERQDRMRCARGSRQHRTRRQLYRWERNRKRQARRNLYRQRNFKGQVESFIDRQHTTRCKLSRCERRRQALEESISGGDSRDFCVDAKDFCRVLTVAEVRAACILTAMHGTRGYLMDCDCCPQIWTCRELT